MTEKKNNEKISIPITSSDLCEERFINLQSTGMDTVSFSPLSIKVHVIKAFIFFFRFL